MDTCGSQEGQQPKQEGTAYREEAACSPGTRIQDLAWPVYSGEGRPHDVLSVQYVALVSILKTLGESVRDFK